MKKKLKSFLILNSFLLLLGFCLATWGFIVEPNLLVVNNYKLKLRKWSPQLNGFKIVAISDIHAGSNFVTENKIKQIVAEANAQNPDLIVLLGDYVSPTLFERQKLKMPVPLIARNLSGLRSKYGVYAVLGNGDEAFGKEEVRDKFEEVGIKVLSDEVTGIDINGEKLFLLGMQNKMRLGDWHVISEHLKQVLADTERNSNLIVLVHNPDYLPVITGALSISDNLCLILAGHTHGGQVRLPFIGAPVIPSINGQKYASGHIRDQDTDMFITTGIGTSLIPVRFGVPPEIAFLTLSQ